MNKVKPFYIRITEDMTPKMVQDALDKLDNAGIKNDINLLTNSFWNWSVFGVTFRNDVFFGNSIPLEAGFNIKEITIDQLDEWLGIAGSSPKQVEWKNGDECIKNGERYIYLSRDPFKEKYSICMHARNRLVYTILTTALSKPETPEQKAERERLEAIKEMAQTPKPCGFSIYDICEQLYDAGYRKQ